LTWPPPPVFSAAKFKGATLRRHAVSRTKVMAKPATVQIKLVSTAGTGHFYVTKKNPRTQTEKLVFRKYDPVIRQHVDYKEAKIK